MIFRHLLNMRSHPTWVRGLKHQTVRASYAVRSVAPYVGAWIETGLPVEIIYVLIVAPYVGAWIETLRTTVPATLSSRTLRGCVD